MKKFLIIILFIPFSIYSQEVKVKRNIQYAPVPEMPYSADSSSNRTLDIYLTDEMSEPKPVFLFVHGGGFSSNDKYSRTLEKIASKIAIRGYAVISVNYRLYLKFNKRPPQAGGWSKFDDYRLRAIDTATEDVVMALDWVKANASKYNLDSNKIVIAGGSAGAMTALNVAYNTDRSVVAVVDMWGAMPDVTKVKNNAPPLLIFHGDADNVVEISHSKALKARMDELGNPCEFVVVEGAGHAIYPVIETDKYIDIICNFLSGVLK